MTDRTDHTARNAKPARRFHCAECGDPAESYRSEAVYCSKVCKSRAQNRELVRGRKSAAMLLEFRRNRGKGKFSYADLTNLGDAWIAEDNARERARKAKIAALEAVEAGKIDRDAGAAFDVVGVANRPLGRIERVEIGGRVGYRYACKYTPDHEAGDAWGYLAPTPEAALGTKWGAPYAKQNAARVFPAGTAPAEIDTRR